MQIKTKMRYPITSTRMGIIKKDKRWQVLERMWIKENLVHCWWECTLVQPPWKTVWRILKKLKIDIFHVVYQSQFGICMQNTWSHYVKQKYAPLCSFQPCSLSSRHGNNLVSIKEAKIKNICIFLSKWSLLFWNNMDESCGHFAEWNQSDKDKYCMSMIIYM